MLTQLELYIIKESAMEHDVIYLYICGKEFVFRTLGIKEYYDIKKCIDTQADFEDAVCQSTLLYPDEYSFSDGLAGIPTIATEHIIKASGIEDIDIVMDRMNSTKHKMNTFYNQCVNLVKSVFTEFAYNEILEWPWEKVIDYAVRAESILNIKGIPVKLIDQRADEVEEEVIKSKSEIGKELRLYGIDPILYHARDYINDKEIIEYPIISHMGWNKEDIVDGIRKQMEHRQKS